MKKILQWAIRKKVLIFFIVLTLTACLCQSNDTKLAGKIVLVNIGTHTDTCTVQYKNFWTGDYCIAKKSGEVLFAAQNEIKFDL